MDMNDFLSGAVMMASAVAALFFFQYWRRVRDRLFAILALAFVMLAVERTALALISIDEEWRYNIFLVRLAAFVLIILGILDKNRRRRATAR